MSKHARGASPSPSVVLADCVEDLRGLAAEADRSGAAGSLHAVRLSSKRLRYTAELLQDDLGEQVKPIVRATKRIQTALGDVHDLDLRIEMIEDELVDVQLELAAASSATIAEDPGRAADALAALVGPIPDDPRPGLIALLSSEHQQRRDALARYRAAWDRLETALVERPGRTS